MDYFTVPITPRLRLWEDEIKNILLKPHLQRILHKATIIDPENDWIKLEKETEDKSQLIDDFFTKFALTKSDEFLEITTSILSDFPWGDFLMNSIPLKKHINFKRIISSSKHPLIDYVLINIIPTEKFVAKLVEKNSIFSEIACKISKILKFNKSAYVYANCVLIRELPFTGMISGDYDEWVKYFLNVLDDFPETKFIIKYFDIDLDNLDSHFLLKVESKDEANCGMDFEDKMIVTPKHPGHFRSQDKFRSTRMRYYNLSDIGKDIELRDYQSTILSPALNGESCVLLLPRKTGKKFCINQLIKNHILSRREKNKPFRVCYVVSSLQSLSENTIALNNFFKNSISIGSSGLIDFSKHTIDKLLIHDVVLVTPTFLYCCLESLITEQKLFYRDFTLMIIEDIQNQICRVSSKFLFDNLFAKKINIQQIVGIYVDISLSYSYHIEDVLSSFYHTCASMRITKVSTPKTYYPDMISFFQNCYDKVFDFEIPDTYFKGLIEMKIGRLVMKLKFLQENGYTFNWNTKDDSLLPPINSYEFMLPLIKIDFELQLSNQNNKIQEMIVVINCLKEYFHAILLSSILPTFYAIKFLKERYHVLKKHIGHFNCFEENFNDINVITNEITEASLKNELNCSLLLMDNLIFVLKNEFSEGHSNHVVIFVPTNSIVDNVEKYLQSILSVYNVNVYGLNNYDANNDDKRMKVFDNFVKEIYSILVTTYVVDWNFNIPDRNLDINLNDCLHDMDACLSAPNLMKRNNRRYLFYYPSYIPLNNATNINRQKTLKQFIERVSKIPKKNFKKKIEGIIETMKEEKDFNDNCENQRTNLFKDNVYKVKCRTCLKYLCSSKFIRKYLNYYVVIDVNFFKRIHIKLNDTIKSDIEITPIGQIICEDCSKENGDLSFKTSKIGNLILHGSTYFCNLKIKNLIWEEEKGEKYIKKSWFDVQRRLAWIDEIKEIEWLSYNNEFSKINAELVDDLKKMVVNDKNRKNNIKNISQIVHLSECLEIFK
uniref:RLR CTR domain-containing protein n=1 Tax=Parastrongyloides trichosuri TaxID=131310 RepID=A0A0N4ZFA5_PARTI